MFDQESVLRDHEAKATGFEFQVLLEEYKSNRNEIQQRLSFQHQITTVSMAVISGIIAAIANLAKDSQWQTDYAWILISLSAACSLLGLVILGAEAGIKRYECGFDLHRRTE